MSPMPMLDTSPCLNAVQTRYDDVSGRAIQAAMTLADDLARQRDLRAAVQLLLDDAYNAEVNAGWYNDPATGERLKVDVPQKLMLIVSELAEALEGHRKNLMDDKLTHRPMFEVELADALIRLLGLAGGTGADLVGSYVEKRVFNDIRPDHKREARLGENGKRY